MKHVTVCSLLLLALGEFLSIPAFSQAVDVAPAQATGTLTLLRVHDLGTEYGAPPDEIDVEVVIWLDSQPGKAFGFQVRIDSKRPARQGMLDLLRDAFNHGWTVTIDYVGADLRDPDTSKPNFVIIRAWLTNPRTNVDISYQYAVKFVCGRTEGNEGLARAEYFSAVNVHNPWERKIAFRKKYAIALQLPKAGQHTPFLDVGLDDDQALEISCRDVVEGTNQISNAEFRTGFIVFESDVELDIVAVYTTAHFETGEIITQDIERVPPREIVRELPDLLPVPDSTTGSFCQTSGGRLLVTIRNQGLAASGPSVTELDLLGLGRSTLDTMELGPDQKTNLLFSVPPEFSEEGDHRFRITADVSGQVAESVESNNVATGVCISVD